MAVLHHVSMDAGDEAAWAEFLAALAEGDSVVLLDRAARRPPGQIGLRPQVRWLLPASERGEQAPPLPAGLDEIDAHDWWTLIAAHPVLLEWN